MSGTTMHRITTLALNQKVTSRALDWSVSLFALIANGSPVLRSLAPELFAQLVLRAHQYPASRCRQIAAGAIDVESQHRKC